MPEYNPEIIILDDAVAVEAHCASVIIEQVVQKPESVLTLPTGGTPLGVYKILVNAYRAGVVDFSGVTALNLDEYWPIGPTDASSYAKYMYDNFFGHVNVPEHSRHIPNGSAEDANAEAERYRALIDSLSIDLGFVSIGPGETCHIAFNERGSEVDSRVRFVHLDDQTKSANSQYFENPVDMPSGALTQGIADVLSAERILFMAVGEHKAWGVRRSFEGEIGPDAPASFLRLHAGVTVVLDSASASLLSL
jgi:glucosamine-6-phosphate deaminase